MKKEFKELLLCMKKYPVVLYGLGQLGNDVGLEILGLLGINATFACDKTFERISDFVSKNPYVVPISYSELLQRKDDLCVFVCVGAKYISTVCDNLSINKSLHIVSVDDIVRCDYFLEKFYSVSDFSRDIKNFSRSDKSYNSDEVQICNNKIAVYTCITANYDTPKEFAIDSDNCDYFYIGEEKPDLSNRIKWIDCNTVVPSYVVNPVDVNRWCKMHGHKIFEEYRYSIYIDGSITLIKDISYYVNLTKNLGIALHRHPHRDCIYEEGFRVYAARRGGYTKNEIVEQMQKYHRMGVPRHYGLFECGMVVRDHAKEFGNIIMEEWFEEFFCSIRRDQLCLPVVLWKKQIDINSIGILNNGMDIRYNPDIVLDDNH